VRGAVRPELQACGLQAAARRSQQRGDRHSAGRDWQHPLHRPHGHPGLVRGGVRTPSLACCRAAISPAASLRKTSYGPRRADRGCLARRKTTLVRPRSRACVLLVGGERMPGDAAWHQQPRAASLAWLQRTAIQTGRSGEARHAGATTCSLMCRLGGQLQCGGAARPRAAKQAGSAGGKRAQWRQRCSGQRANSRKRSCVSLARAAGSASQLPWPQAGRVQQRAGRVGNRGCDPLQSCLFRAWLLQRGSARMPQARHGRKAGRPRT